MLQVDGVSARIGPGFRIEGVSLGVEPGEIVAVLGPNGSGKTSLLRLVCGLQAPEAGTIAWSGRPLSRDMRVLVPPEEREMAFVAQGGVLFPHLSVRENVALGVGPRVPSGESDARVEAALRMVQLEAIAARAAPSLSGGEHQRTALARALAARPRVLLLDEPLHSLDGPVKRSIAARLRAVVQDRTIAALFVTHDADEASAMADRAVLLRAGRVVQQGTTQQLYEAPVDGWAARFLGEVEMLEARSAREQGIDLPEAAAGPSICFRREDLVLESAQSPGPGLEVVQVRARGALHEVSVRAEDGSVLVSRGIGPCPFERGQRVRGRVARALPPCAADGLDPRRR